MTRRVGIVLAALLAVLTANAIIVGRERTAATPFGGGRVLELDGPDLNVREYGPSNGRAIVLLHGYAASIEWWDPVAERLAAEGNRVIAVDLVGHGGSEAPADDEAYSADSQSDAVVAALRELDVRRADLVGHSMGGDVATAIVERFPSLVERVVVIDTFAAPGLLDEGVLARAACWPIVGAALDRLRSLDAASESSLQTAFAPDYPVPDVAHRSLERLTHRGVCEADAGVAMNEQMPVAERLAAAKVPVLVVWGGRDTRAPTAANVARYEEAGMRTKVISRSGHSPNLETPGALARILTRFIGSTKRGQGHV